MPGFDQGEPSSVSPVTPRQPYLDALQERVIVFDGAFGTFVQGLASAPTISAASPTKAATSCSAPPVRT